VKKIKFGPTDLEVSSVILGLMRINNAKDPVKVLTTAIENDITFFDHADIYGRGECETIFAEALAKTEAKREELFIQSKCGIVPGEMFDFSKEHIISSVEGSLQRLKTDHLDALLLHRPDTLFEPEEVAAAFDQLEKDGKVVRPALGIRTINLSSITSQQQEQILKVPSSVTDGVVVYSVNNATPAEQAGLKQYDVITKIDDTDISTTTDLQSALYKHKVGDTITVTFYRGKEEKTAKVVLSVDTSINEQSTNSSN